MNEPMPTIYTRADQSKEARQIIKDLDVLEEKIGNIPDEVKTEKDAEIIQEVFKIANALCSSWNTFEGIVHYRDVRRQYLEPRLKVATRYAEGSSEPDKAQKYIDDITRLLDDIDTLYAAEENHSLEELREAMADELGLPLDTPLQHIALHALLCTDGVGVVLVGMRRPEYVDDCLAATHLPESPYHRSTWNRIAAHLARLSA